MAKDGELTARQKMFCIHRALNGGNGTQAYKDAGYKPSNDGSAAAAASRLLKNVKVQEMADELESETSTPFVLSIKDRKELLSKIGADKNCSANERINAIDKLNKMDGVYVQKQEITTAVPVVIHDNVSE